MLPRLKNDHPLVINVFPMLHQIVEVVCKSNVIEILFQEIIMI